MLPLCIKMKPKPKPVSTDPNMHAIKLSLGPISCSRVPSSCISRVCTKRSIKVTDTMVKMVLSINLNPSTFSPDSISTAFITKYT